MALKRIGAGNRMSSAVIHGGRVYLAGFVAEAAAGRSVKEQTQDILTQIDAVLKEAGTDKSMLLKTNIWLTDISTFAQMNEAWDAWVIAGQAPARATVESKLAAPGLDVEIMVEAAIPGAGGAGRAARKAGAGARKAGGAAKKAGGGKGKGGGGGGGGGGKNPEKRAARKAARKAARQAQKAGK
jgi:enamine deaminase RidA (YjgF/YER057c/UK114 family)